MVPTIDIPPLDAIALLKSNGIIPRKSLGQNFLIDPHALKRIVACAELPESAIILEIGAGLGSLTRYLAQVAQHVITIELDQKLIPILHQVLDKTQNVQVIHGDILEMNISQLVREKKYLVVANIPYYITSVLIRRLLETSPKPDRIVLTIQREVAERICARTGKMSLLALSVQVYGVPQMVYRIPGGAFYPSPNVDSTVIRVDLHNKPIIPDEMIAEFFMLARAGFSQKRKTLRNALAGGMCCSTTYTAQLLEACQIDPNRRAETLSLNEWQLLTGYYVSLKALNRDT